ncbi:MAG: peptidoglycan editing factor PgeF [Campylobacterota bacterium]|nr:peptidoglycan editing factor PgeF [Campylobacterota bacterium]
MLDIYQFKDFSKHEILMHGITKKDTSLPYDFSLALHTGEKKETIIENRKHLLSIWDTNRPTHFVLANQTHSDHIYIICNNKTRGWLTLDDAIEDCDALITDVSNIILSILTADCVPILLYDTNKNVVAAIHAGWKGTKANIVYKTVQKMIEVYGSNPNDIKAGIGPSIGECCYEVGYDVAKHFSDIPQAYTKKTDKYMLNLPNINYHQLLDAKLLAKNIELSHICTACDVKNYFSYRKEKGCTGRFISMIGMRDEHKNYEVEK